MADVGVKLKVDGEKEFREAIKECNAVYKDLNSEMKLAKAEFDNAGDKQKYLSDQAGILTSMIKNQEEKVVSLSTQLAKVRYEYGENSVQLHDHQAKLNEAKAALVDLQTQEQKNAKETKEYTEELKNNKKHTVDLEKAWSGLATAGKVMGAAMAAVGTAALTAGKKIFDMANEVSSTADNIDKMSQKIGISAEAFQEWDYVFKMSGADVSGLQTGMKELSGIIVDAGNGSESAAAKLEAVGLSLDDLAGKSQTEQLQTVITALQGMESGATRTTAATDLLGKSATEMAAVLNMSAEETAAMKQEAHDYGMVMSDEAVSAGATFNDSLTRLQDTVSGLKNSFVSELLPGITMIMDGISGLVAGNDDAVNTLKNGVQTTIETIAGILPQVVELLPPMISTILTALIELFPSLMDVVIELFNSLVDMLLAHLPELIPVAFEAVMTIVNKLIDSLPEIINSAIQIVESLVTGITEALPELIPAAVGAILTICTSLIDNLPEILHAGLQLIVGLGNGLLAALPDLIAQLPEIISGIVDFLIESMPMIIAAGIQLLGGLIKAIPEVILVLLEKLPDIVIGIFEALTSPDSLSMLADAGLELIEGLWQGISDAGKWLWDQISGFFGGIVDGICGFFGIHSPSTVFAGIGKNLMLGMEKGIDKESKHVLDDVTGIAEDISSAMPISGSVALSDTKNGKFAKGSSVINIYPQELNNSTVDYLFQRFNAKMGATV
jgi:hypothetical protein